MIAPPSLSTDAWLSPAGPQAAPGPSASSPAGAASSGWFDGLTPAAAAITTDLPAAVRGQGVDQHAARVLAALGVEPALRRP